MKENLEESTLKDVYNRKRYKKYYLHQKKGNLNTFKF